MMFARQGFEATTVDAIATAAGVARRTFFRYFNCKNDVVWGSFTEQLATMRAHFHAHPPHEPLWDVIRTVVVEFNRIDPEEAPRHRLRLELILTVPELQAHSTLRYADWRHVIADYAAQRFGLAHSDLLPQSLAHASLGVAVAAYEHWIAHPTTDLCALLNQSFHILAAEFTIPTPSNYQ